MRMYGYTLQIVWKYWVKLNKSVHRNLKKHGEKWLNNYINNCCVSHPVLFSPFWLIDSEHIVFLQLDLTLHLVGLFYKNCCLRPKIHITLGSLSTAELSHFNWIASRSFTSDAISTFLASTVLFRVGSLCWLFLGTYQPPEWHPAVWNHGCSCWLAKRLSVT